MSALDDQTIAKLIQEPKSIPEGLLPPVKLITRNRHKRRDYELVAPSGNRFVVHVRQSELNIMDFSAILGYRLPELHSIFRLCRYNGRHQHTNVLEKQTFYDFHIHIATLRYQVSGFSEDHFAKTTKA
jgi:hypothetical protein